jgi:Ala-tRNA(Pro) deacylase
MTQPDPSSHSAADDGAVRPADEAALLAFLDDLGIAYTHHTHPPLFTVEESQELRGQLPGGHCKNLFLKAKKGGLWLAVCLEDRQIRTKHLEKAVGAKRLSFGSAELLGETLGVKPGAVTPFGLINDRQAHAVTLVLDQQMMDHDILYYHPLHNEATIGVSSVDMMRFFEATGHTPTMVDFDALEAQAREDAAA